MLGKLQHAMSIWSTATKVAVSVVATTSVVAVGGVVTYNLLSEVDHTPEVIIAEASGDASGDLVLNEAVQDIVEVPEYSTVAITGESLVQDLTMYLMDENNKKIVGHEFSVAILSDKQYKELSSYIEKVEEIDEKIAALGEDKSSDSDSDSDAGDEQTSGTRNIPTRADKEKEKAAGGSTSAENKTEDTSSAVEANEAASDEESAKADAEESKKTATEEKTNEAADSKAADLLSKVNKADADVQVSSVTGKELTEKEKLLLEKAEAMKEYRKALVDLKADTYTDEDADGVIAIKKIDGGTYYAALVPNETFIPAAFDTEVVVKSELEYKALQNIEMKAVEADDSQDEEEAVEETPVEEVLKDTVEYVASTKNPVNTQYTKASASNLPSSSVSSEVNKASYSVTQAGSVPNVNGMEKSAAQSAIEAVIYTDAVYELDENNVVKKDENGNDIIKTAAVYYKYAEGTSTSHETIAKDHVISYSESGGIVTVILSTGKAEAETPTPETPATTAKVPTDLKNKTKADAKKALSDLGFTNIKEAEAYSSTVAEGAVISVSDEGQTVEKTKELTLTISKGAEPSNANLTLSKSAVIYSSSYSGLNTANLALTVSGLSDLTVKSSDESKATAKISGSSVVVTAKTGLTSDATVTITVSSTATIGGEKRTYTVTSAVTVKSGSTKLTDSSGNQLYADEKGTLATVGNYTGTCYTKSESYTYTGWQTINGVTYYYDKNGNVVTGTQVISGSKYTFGSNGALQASGYGIDVSKWQGKIDWTQAKSAISFAIIRAGYRGSANHSLMEDSYVDYNIRNAKANGVRVGLYFYSIAMSEAEAVEEASLAVAIANRNGGGLSMPIFIDMEASQQKGLSTAQRDAIVLAFARTVRSAGYSAGVYANKTWLTTLMTPSSYSGLTIWCAQYNTSCTYTGHKDIWQYTSSGSVPGISGRVDMNISYM